MPCYFPLQGWRSRALTPNGKRLVVFDRGKGYVDQPITIPCGKCIGCRLERSRQWALRCMSEAQLHSTNSFITLTYSDDFLPSDLSLDKSHFQNFMKRLRFANPDKKIRFYACGEYGENLSRPHYHAIIFNHDFTPRVHHSTRGGHRLYVSDELSKLWPHGFHYIGEVNFDSAAYVARYITKKIGGDLAAEHYQGRMPEFSLMSLKPGIGLEWFKKYHKDLFPTDFMIHNGVKNSVPRYFDNLLERLNPALLAKIKSKRKKAQLTNADNSTLRRLQVRHTVKLSQTKTLHRHMEKNYAT